MKVIELGKLEHPFKIDQASLYPHPEGHRLLTLSKEKMLVTIFLIRGKIKELKHKKEEQASFPKMEKYTMAKKKTI